MAKYGDDSLSMDEFDHAVLAFELFGRQMRHVTDDPCEWVWAIIALHSGIQSMMVLALTGTDGLNALGKKDHGRWLNAYRQGEPCPSNLQLDKFLNLYKKVGRNNRLNFVPGDRQNCFVERLNEWRNLFIHFPHQILVFGREEFYPMASDCLGIAEALFEALTDDAPENLWRGNSLIRSKPDTKERLQKAFTSARQFLDSHG